MVKKIETIICPYGEWVGTLDAGFIIGSVPMASGRLDSLHAPLIYSWFGNEKRSKFKSERLKNCYCERSELSSLFNGSDFPYHAESAIALSM